MVSKASHSQYPLPGLCRKDPEANTKPLTQMPVEFARKPGLLLATATEKAHLIQLPKQVLWVLIRRGPLSRRPGEGAPVKVLHKVPAMQASGNQCVWIFCAHSVFPTEETRFKKPCRHKRLSWLKAWNIPNCSYLCILLLPIRHRANGHKPQETGAP